VDPVTEATKPAARPCKGRIVLTTLGSLGDLHPYIAIARGLQARGHEAVIATSPCYRQKVEALRLGYRAIRPDSAWVADAAVMRRFMHLGWGLVRVGREWILPALRESYEDILAASEGADLLVSHPLAAYATRLVAEKTGIPWASTVPVPMAFFSVYDLGMVNAAPFFLNHLRFLGPTFWTALRWLGKRATRFLAKPWYRLRAEIGLPPTHEANPLSDSHSASLVLALFSPVLADKQPDWPPQTVLTGFPLYDQDGEGGLPPSLARFLDAGPPPIVFTLGSAVATDAGPFFERSIAAAQLLGCRAVLILKDAGNRLPTLPEGMAAFDHAPFSELFPRAAVIVHHGGIGTTGLAMRSGRPMLVMPCAWDQPDHAERVTRLGIARTVSRNRYTPGRVAAELRELLDKPAYLERAAEVGEQVRKEDGARAACDALEALLHAVVPPTRRQLGTLKGTVLYMAPDFDARLEEFKEYME
jgi:rhamnosyltransferase subunit B